MLIIFGHWKTEIQYTFKQKDATTLGSKSQNKFVKSSIELVKLKSCKIFFGDTFYTEMVIWILISLRSGCYYIKFYKMKHI